MKQANQSANNPSPTLNLAPHGGFPPLPDHPSRLALMLAPAPSPISTLHGPLNLLNTLSPPTSAPHVPPTRSRPRHVQIRTCSPWRAGRESEREQISSAAKPAKYASRTRLHLQRHAAILRCLRIQDALPSPHHLPANARLGLVAIVVQSPLGRDSRPVHGCIPVPLAGIATAKRSHGAPIVCPRLAHV